MFKVSSISALIYNLNIKYNFNAQLKRVYRANVIMMEAIAIFLRLHYVKTIPLIGASVIVGLI